MNSNDRVTLNVGGKRFETTRKTLSLHPNSLLARMFSFENASLLRADVDGSCFFDRDPDLFQHVLNFYRLNMVPTFANESLNEILKEEFRFWNVNTESCSDYDEGSTKKLLEQLDFDTNDKNCFIVVGANLISFLEAFVFVGYLSSKMNIEISSTGFGSCQMDNNEVALLDFNFPIAFFKEFSFENKAKFIIADYETNFKSLRHMVASQNQTHTFALKGVLDVINSLFCFKLVGRVKKGFAGSEKTEMSFQMLFSKSFEDFTFENTAPLVAVMKTRDLERFMGKLCIQQFCPCWERGHISFSVTDNEFTVLTELSLSESFKHKTSVAFLPGTNRLCFPNKMEIPFYSALFKQDHIEMGEELGSKEKDEEEDEEEGDMGEKDIKDRFGTAEERQVFYKEWERKNENKEYKTVYREIYIREMLKKLPKTSTDTCIYFKDHWPVEFKVHLINCGTLRFILSPIEIVKHLQEIQEEQRNLSQDL